MDRQEGYYWVKYKNRFIAAKYTTYRLNDSWWSLPGENNSYQDSDFEHINEIRIKEPGELPD